MPEFPSDIKTSSPGASRKGYILALLRTQKDWCSGEAISSRLAISRAAVAKHVTALRREGHAIMAVPRRGYRLLAEADAIDFEQVSSVLATSRFGKNWRFKDESSSTNTEALVWAMEGAEEGSIVFAERQTNGRGRKGHDWVSTPRGLQFSLVLRPSPACRELTSLTLMATMSVAEAIRSVSGLAAQVKLPNDVLVNGKKICGVLVEEGLRGGETDWTVLGIGCNVNAVAEDFPADMLEKASSLLIESGRPLQRTVLLSAILERLEYRYDRADAGIPDDLAGRCGQLASPPAADS